MSAPTTAKRQSTRKPVERQCYRFPCDLAYGRRAHTKDEHGHVRHACGVDGSQDRDWEVSLFAIDDGPWRIAVRLGDGPRFEIQPRSVVDLGRSRRNEHEYAAAMLQNAAELSGAISLAVAWWVGAR